MSTSYDYDETEAAHADAIANRLDQCGAYIGTFTKAEALTTAKGGKGIFLEFESVEGGKVGLNLYTEGADGTAHFGKAQLYAIFACIGLRGMKSVAGKVSTWMDGVKVEVDGEIFPDLLGKKVGLVLQRENYTKQDGGDGYRMNIFGIFNSTNRLTASEMKEGKVEPKKLESMLRSCKVKDSRKAKVAEPAQPSIAVGGY